MKAPCVCQYATQYEQLGQGALDGLQPLTVPATGPVVKYWPVVLSLQTFPQYSTFWLIDVGFAERRARRAAIVWFLDLGALGSQPQRPNGSIVLVGSAPLYP